MTPNELKHRNYHESYYLWCALLLLVDIVAVPFAQYAYQDKDAALVLLLPTLPVVAIAISHWIASGFPPSKCTCGKYRSKP